MNILTGDNFDEGFVQACMDRNLNVEQITELHKIASYAEAFNKEEFIKGFTDIVGVHRAENMSILEKAACVKEYLETLIK